MGAITPFFMENPTREVNIFVTKRGYIQWLKKRKVIHNCPPTEANRFNRHCDTVRNRLVHYWKSLMDH